MGKYEKTKIFLLGVIVALLFVYVAQMNTAKADTQTNTDSNENEIGRYQISACSYNDNACWVIDTKTSNIRMVSYSFSGLVFTD